MSFQYFHVLMGSTFIKADGRRNHQMCSIKKGFFLKVSQNSEENTRVGVSFIKKRDSNKSVSGEYCEIFKNTIFTEHLRTTASVKSKLKHEDNQYSYFPQVVCQILVDFIISFLPFLCFQNDNRNNSLL